jgi:hypothetical protein
VIHVVAGHVEDATWMLAELTQHDQNCAHFKSRDFK